MKNQINYLAKISCVFVFVLFSRMTNAQKELPQNRFIVENYALDEDDTLRYKNHYVFENAYRTIEDMLTGKRELDFKTAVFAVENAYYDGKLDSAMFFGDIERISKGVKMTAKSLNTKMINKDMALNYCIYLFYTRSAPLNNYHPYEYDLEAITDSDNIETSFVSHLLLTGKGTCHSLPYLYKIIADEVEAKAFIAAAPMHYYIRTQDDKGKWFNFETTTGSFSRDSFYIESFHVNENAIKSGLYMTNLTKEGTLVQCLYDLLNIYEYKTGFYSNFFVRKCCELGLKYHYADNLHTWEIEDMHYQVNKKAWMKGYTTKKEIVEDSELAPLYWQYREKMAEFIDMGYYEFTSAEYSEKFMRAMEYVNNK